jgi:hypothetical protein
LLAYIFVGLSIVLIYVIGGASRPASRTRLGRSVLGHVSRTHRLTGIIVGLILISFAGFRFGVGTDYFLYRALYNRVEADSLLNTFATSTTESGYTLLMFVVKASGGNFQTLLLIASALTVTPVLLAIARRSVSPASSLYFYFFLGAFVVSFNNVRQAIAVSLLFYADTFRDDKKLIWILLSVLACTFHISAIIFIVVQIASARWKPSLRDIALGMVLIAALATTLVSSGGMEAVASLLNDRYTTYLDVQGAGAGSLLTLIIQILLMVYIAVVTPRDFSPRYKSYLFASVAVMILAQANLLLARFDQYFVIFLVLLIPEVMVHQKSKWLNFVLITLTFTYFLVYVSSYNEVLPYGFVVGQ